MLFALLFFVSFLIGVIAYVLSDRWWLAGALLSVALLAFSQIGLNESAFQDMALYFGVPIVFLGSLFGAYIVQLRRAPDLDDTAEASSESQDEPQTDSQADSQAESENENPNSK